LDVRIGHNTKKEEHTGQRAESTEAGPQGETLVNPPQDREQRKTLNNWMYLEKLLLEHVIR
jgi:hypothetical protein